MEHRLKILITEFVTHDVKKFIIEKPRGYSFVPGQATLVSINKLELKSEKRPFTFTSLNSDLVLEFIIKNYPAHKGVTHALHNINSGEEILIEEPFGTINYARKGVFIAGGAGITPFIAIFRQLQKDKNLEGNMLIFSNKTSRDIILEQELKELFGKNLILTLTQEKNPEYDNKKIDGEFLKEKIKDFSQHFYICGPESFVLDIKKFLKELGASSSSLISEGKI